MSARYTAEAEALLLALGRYAAEQSHSEGWKERVEVRHALAALERASAAREPDQSLEAHIEAWQERAERAEAELARLRGMAENDAAVEAAYGVLTGRASILATTHKTKAWDRTVWMLRAAVAAVAPEA